MRNILYDLNVIKSNEFRIPVISIGNITVGGTGKTPHTEYLIRLLKNQHKVAFLSRGYKRKTSGFQLGNISSTVEDIGDEPKQIFDKFSDIVVAVDSNRVNGIRKIKKQFPEVEIILLDDAFQHRSVKPGINILLIDFNKPIFGDMLLPSGRLREHASEYKRANVIIITKVPEQISAIDKRLFLKKIRLGDHQKIYFTSISYSNPKPVFPGTETLPDFGDNNLSVFLVTGIANANPLLNYIKIKYHLAGHINFPDHHFFSEEDIKRITDQFNAIPAKTKVILTTEKDAVRFRALQLKSIDREKWYYIPIEVEFHQGEKEQFNNQIINYVSKNNKNSLLFKK